MMPAPLPSPLALPDGTTVSSLLTEAPQPFARLVLAHGAGAGMDHPFMSAVAQGLAERGVTTLRYQFPYMEAGSKRVDRPDVAHAAVRAAVRHAVSKAPHDLPVFAGGKSFGARMTSQAQALEALPGMLGLVFFGFPLHPAGKPATDRALHLSDVGIPMLFLQGTRDKLAEMTLLSGVLEHLGPTTTLVTIAEADHSFHVPVRSGRTDDQVLQGMLDEAAQWMRTLVER